MRDESKKQRINYMNELQTLMDDISEWSDSTFGAMQRNPAIVWHLKKEVDELIQALDYTHSLGIDESVGAGEFEKCGTRNLHMPS